MDTGFLFGMLNTFWNEIEVMVAQPGEYPLGHC